MLSRWTRFACIHRSTCSSSLSSSSSNSITLNALNRVYKLAFLPAVCIFLAIAIATICWQASYTNRPGPETYYSHFSGLQFAAALAFDALQAIRLDYWPRARDQRFLRGRVLQLITYTYWIILAASAFACTISYGLVPKPESTAIQVLILLNSLLVLTKITADGFSFTKIDIYGTQTTEYPTSKQIPGMKRYVLATCRYFNSLLKVVRFVLSVLYVVGAAGLARQYRFTNPGTISHVVLDSGASLSINYYCTTASVTNSSAMPTIWFEADGAHGVTDFIGVQTFLAELHGRNSCSYDPPSFGWSSRLPSSESTDLTVVFNTLVRAIQRENETKVLAGWSAGGENVLRHASQNSDTVKGVALLDVSPNGIEWLDAKRARNLTAKDTMTLAKTDLRGRISMMQIILAVGFPWGLLSVFISGNDTGYFDKAAYPRHHAQSLKEDMWALQYYSLLGMEQDPFSPVLEDIPVPAGLPVYMIASYTSGTDDASSAFYRDEKLQLGRAVAGGDLGKPVTWCTDSDCSLSFPVTKPAWTASELINLGI